METKSISLGRKRIKNIGFVSPTKLPEAYRVHSMGRPEEFVT